MLKKPISFLIFLFGLHASVNSTGSERSFELKTHFLRNPKIWGTYKVSLEKITINNLSWELPKKVNDLVISDGHLVFVRETKEKQVTKMVVERIPYTKEEKNYKNQNKGIIQEKLERLLTSTLSEQLHLKEEEKLTYDKVNCTRTKRNLVCTVKGQVTVN